MPNRERHRGWKHFDNSASFDSTVTVAGATTFTNENNYDYTSTFDKAIRLERLTTIPAAQPTTGTGTLFVFYNSTTATLCINTTGNNWLYFNTTTVVPTISGVA
jgi:hypothetical protein